MESRDQNPSLRDKVGLGLFMGLRAMTEDAITHRDVCSLSYLKERGTLDISRVRVFLQIEPYGETLTLEVSLAHISQESVLEEEQPTLHEI